MVWPLKVPARERASPACFVRIENYVHGAVEIVAIAMHPFQFIVQSVHISLETVGSENERVAAVPGEGDDHCGLGTVVVHLLVAYAALRENVFIPGFVFAQKLLRSLVGDCVDEHLGKSRRRKLRRVGGGETGRARAYERSD